MTKVELEEFVREVFASFNQTFYENDRDVILRAWWALLQDLEISVVRDRFIQIAVVARVMPTPGAIRRSVVDELLEVVPPSAQQAWAQLRQMSENVNRGTHQAMDVHDVFAKTIKILGDSAFGLSTNGDREYFMNIYTEQLNLYMISAYEVKT
jgi:hypothetical protein